MSFIKRNLYLIFLIAGIVAFSLVFSPFYTILSNLNGNEITTYEVFMIVQLSSIVISAIVFIVMGARREMSKLLLITTIVIYFAASFALNIIQIVESQQYNLILNMAVDVLAIVFMVFALTNKKYFLAAFIIILVDSARLLLGVFGSSATSFAGLIINTLLIASIYFYDDNVYQSNEYYS